MFEAVIFDWDGTLADTRKVIVNSFHRALQEIGLDVSTEYVERRIGIGAAETFRDILLTKKGVADELLVKRLIERKSQVQMELAGEVQLFEGARELLELLQGKVKVGLASMNNRAVISCLLETNNLADCFEVVLTAERVTHSKPDPEIFLKAAEDLQSQPEGCVVLEDSIFGAQAARLAGMCCVAVATGVYSVEELKKEKPNLIVKSLKDPKVSQFLLG